MYLVLFATLFLSFGTLLQGMGTKTVDYTPCKVIKQLQPPDPQEKYFSVAQNLHAHNLSTCQCLRDYFLIEKRDKARKEVEKEFNLPSSVWSNIDEIIHKIDIKDSINHQMGIEQNFHSSADMPKLEQLLTKIRQNQKIVSPIQIDIDVTDNTNPSTHRLNKIKGFTINNGLLIPHIKSEQHILNLPKCLLKRDSNRLYTILLHEMHHIKNNHNLRGKLLVFYIEYYKNKKCNFAKITSLNDLPSHRENPKIKKLKRSQEAECESIPAACNSCLEAQIVEKWSLPVPCPKNEHQSPAKINTWLTRIRKLKEAEEHISKEELTKQKQKEIAEQTWHMQQKRERKQKENYLFKTFFN